MHSEAQPGKTSSNHSRRAQGEGKRQRRTWGRSPEGPEQARGGSSWTESSLQGKVQGCFEPLLGCLFVLGQPIAHFSFY